LATVRRCPGCGEVFWSPEEAERARLAAAEEIRTREGLLLASEIRELRRSIGLTQPDFERLLGVGPKTAARWEAGTVFQSGAADHLMRVVREVPGAAEHLAARNGVRLRPVRHEPRRRSA
jgi:putative zinc finger/helix-turn-helix YgiT family protein